MDIEFANSLYTCVQIIVPVCLLAGSLPLREPRRAALPLAGVLFLAWSVILGVLMPRALGENMVLLAVAIFGWSLIMSWGIVFVAFQASPWTALFCATAGYTMQNLATSFGSLLLIVEPSLAQGIINISSLICVAVYAVCYATFIRRVTRDGLELIAPQVALPMMVVVILAVIAYDAAVKQFGSLGIPDWVAIVARLSHIMLCLLVLLLEYELLYGRRLRQEVAAISRTMELERVQYQVSRETIEAINIKCHDIRQQIRQLGEQSGSVDPQVLDEIEHEVEVYDAAVRTGFEPLDVILTEKGLICQREGIVLTCMADGDCLSFMAPADLYSLLGNALDNAIEAAREVPESEGRSVSVVVRRSGDMALIHVENFFMGERSFKNGLPQTTKADTSSHGYGMRSMQLVALRYNGSLHASVKDRVFHLNVLMPLNE